MPGKTSLKLRSTNKHTAIDRVRGGYCVTTRVVQYPGQEETRRYAKERFQTCRMAEPYV